MISFQELYNKIKKESDSNYANAYHETSSYFVNLLNKNQNLSDADLEKLIKKQSNGIADAGQWGACNQEQFNNIKNVWNEIYEIIKRGKSEHLSAKQYLDVRNIVKTSCKKDKKIIVNRIFAAFFPTEVTATCKEDDFYTVANFMHDKYSNYPEITNNWLMDNYNFIDFCKKNITEDENLPFSVFSWKLRDAIKDKMNFNEAGETNMSKIEELKELLEANKNIILHGAPGTGKTYLAKDIAAQMICEKSFEEIEKDPDSLKAFNEQTEFVQFHPSYDYSDFVEGLRPVEGDNGEVGFERKDGVFKEFCERALNNLVDSKKSVDELKSQLTFEDAFNLLCNKIQNSEISEIELRNGINMDILGLNSNMTSIYLKTKNSTAKPYTFSLDRLMKLSKVFKNENDLNSISNMDKEIRAIIGGCHSSGYWGILNKIYSLIHDISSESKTISEVTPKNYIFIIDEINRGELSKIFGELFFSIEPSYRGPKGKVRTQYANMMKESNSFDDELNSSTFGNFFIPENVYIIGTMNDIDRSVESMDFAMRRRFVFEEVTAEDSAKNMNLPQEAIDRMTSINDVIHETEGLGDAYKIGGAYFLGVDDFDLLWKIKLSSLIKEYLRGIDDDGTKFTKIEEAYFGKLIDSSSNEDTESTSSNGNV